APVRLRIEEATAATQAPPSPAEREAQQKDAQRREVEARVRSHTSVESALRLLGGEIEQIQVLDSEAADSPADTGDEAS
ncbi:MAG TPA: DNA polymerase III subunit gamma/tau, partial [Myxococcaceae bacterium]|nr:DNA polymerase III subunit gamma/tau [Myxococcaceae bacterium]